MKRFTIYAACGDGLAESTGHAGADIVTAVAVSEDRPPDAWRDLMTFVQNAIKGDTFRPSKSVLLLCTQTR